MSFLPSSSDGIANLMGIGALVGMLTGAKPPRGRSGSPGFLTMLLQDSMAREQEERAARAAQDKMRGQFMGTMLPGLVSSGLQIDDHFDDGTYSYMGLNKDAFARSSADTFAGKVHGETKELLPHLPPEAVAKIPHLKTYQDVLEFNIEYGPVATEALNIYRILEKQMGSTAGLRVMEGMTPEMTKEMFGGMHTDGVNVAHNIGVGARNVTEGERKFTTDHENRKTWNEMQVLGQKHRNAVNLIGARSKAAAANKAENPLVTPKDVEALGGSLMKVVAGVKPGDFKPFDGRGWQYDNDEAKLQAAKDKHELEQRKRVEQERQDKIMQASSAATRSWVRSRTSGLAPEAALAVEREASALFGDVMGSYGFQSDAKIMGPREAAMLDETALKVAKEYAARGEKPWEKMTEKEQSELLTVVKREITKKDNVYVW